MLLTESFEEVYETLVRWGGVILELGGEDISCSFGEVSGMMERRYVAAAAAGRLQKRCPPHPAPPCRGSHPAPSSLESSSPRRRVPGHRPHASVLAVREASTLGSSTSGNCVDASRITGTREDGSRRSASDTWVATSRFPLLVDPIGVHMPAPAALPGARTRRRCRERAVARHEHRPRRRPQCPDRASGRVAMATPSSCWRRAWSRRRRDRSRRRPCLGFRGPWPHAAQDRVVVI